MKTIQCNKPLELAPHETQKPIPGEDEALLRIRRVGICGTDLHAYQGKQPYFEYPRILGHELSAVIERVPENYNHEFSDGTPVAVIPYLECGKCMACRNGLTNCCRKMQVLGVHADGGMREFMTVPADHLLRADGLDVDEIALVEPFAIGAHAVRRAGVRPGEQVLVIGAGPIGLSVMQFARVAGAQIIAMDISEMRLEFCRNYLEVQHTVHGSSNPLDAIKEITSGDFAPVVIDATGNRDSMQSALGYLGHGGRLVYVGLFQGEFSLNDPEFHKRETTLLSSRNATREDFSHVIRCMRDRKVITTPLITHRASTDTVIYQFPSWLDPKSAVIKAVVEFSA